MLDYLVNFICAFLSVSLVAGALLALRTGPDGNRGERPFAVALVSGVLGGVAAYLASRHQGLLTAVRTALYGTALLAVLGNAAALLPPTPRSRAASLAGRGAALFLCALLAAAATFSFAGFVAEQALTTSTVLNTELILNLGGVGAGFLLIALLIPLAAGLGGKAGKRALAALVLAASLLLAVQWGAELLLGLMRLEVIELTSLRVSIVAKVGKYSKLFPYVQAVLIAALSLVYYCKRTRISATELSGMEPAPRRKARALLMGEMRWFKCTASCLSIVLSVLLFHDLYASRPPRISPPLQLKPDAQGEIRVKVGDMADGKLHRYSYLTDDGHVVRFFMLAHPGGKKIGVVYDACMMCGDMGYLQQKSEVICLACNVRIFIPSIGKSGGCNPIPLKHAIDGGSVVVAAEELDRGAKYFSEVVPVQVKDPVTGKELLSDRTPLRYEFQGRTYFFASQESLEKFKVAPEKFVGNRGARYYRVQGFRGE